MTGLGVSITCLGLRVAVTVTVVSGVPPESGRAEVGPCAAAGLARPATAAAKAMAVNGRNALFDKEMLRNRLILWLKLK
jgi:hypothetical protein